MRHLDELREQVRSAANRPGVYRFLGAEDEVLYVGKSVRVRGRLLSYFRADREEKAARILVAARRVTWEYVPDEFTALLREFREIRRHRPVFNVEHRRERVVCFLKVPREPAPRLLVVKSVAADGAAYYGPLLGIGHVREAARDLADAFWLRDCAASTPLRLADQTDLFGASYARLCPRAELRRCLAPCAAGCTESEYARRVAACTAFLEGASDEPLELLRQRMAAAAERLQYEHAAVLRERITRLEGVRAELLKLRRLLGMLDFVYLPAGPEPGARLYLVRSGRIVYESAVPASRRETRAVRARLRMLASKPVPSFARLGPDGIAEVLLVARWFRRRPDEISRSVGARPARERLEVARPA